MVGEPPTSCRVLSKTLELLLENFHRSAVEKWRPKGNAISNMKPSLLRIGLTRWREPCDMRSIGMGFLLCFGLAFARRAIISSGSVGISPLLDSRIF